MHVCRFLDRRVVAMAAVANIEAGTCMVPDMVHARCSGQGVRLAKVFVWPRCLGQALPPEHTRVQPRRGQVTRMHMHAYAHARVCRPDQLLWQL